MIHKLVEAKMTQKIILERYCPRLAKLTLPIDTISSIASPNKTGTYNCKMTENIASNILTINTKRYLPIKCINLKNTFLFFIMQIPPLYVLYVFQGTVNNRFLDIQDNLSLRNHAFRYLLNYHYLKQVSCQLYQ